MCQKTSIQYLESDLKELGDIPSNAAFLHKNNLYIPAWGMDQNRVRADDDRGAYYIQVKDNITIVVYLTFTCKVRPVSMTIELKDLSTSEECSNELAQYQRNV